MNKLNSILGRLFRILAIIILIVLNLLNFLTVILSPLVKSLYDISEIVVVVNKTINLFFVVTFTYGIFLLIKNSRKYLKLFGYFLPGYYLYLTIYRFFFITHGQFENTDISNLLIFMVPLAIMFVSYKMEPPAITAEKTPQTSATDFSPQDIVSPASESRPFSPLQYQGFLVRGLANIIDQILIILPLVAFASMTGTGSSGHSEAYIVIGGLLFLVYLTVAEVVWGQTLGKKLFGIKVMMQDGKNCTWTGAILRNFFRIVDTILGGYILGIIVIIITPKKQRIGDLIAKTVVVKP